MSDFPRKNGPWTIISTEQKYKNPWLAVHEDQVIRPDGKPGIFAVIDYGSGISALPMDEEGFVYLGQKFAYVVGADTIEASSGGLEGEEIPLNAAKRELKEELGIEGKEWVDLGVVNPFTMVIHSPAYLFLVKKLSFTKPIDDPMEVMEQIKVPFDEAVAMVMDGRITHAPTVALILKAKVYVEDINFEN